MELVNETPGPAKHRSVRVSDDPEVIRQLEDLHYLAIAVCPDCQVSRRTEGELIYCIDERKAEPYTHLLTVWPRKTVGMRIVFEEKKKQQVPYSPAERPDYFRRMSELYRLELLPRAQKKAH